jgi:hypothetical protein
MEGNAKVIVGITYFGIAYEGDGDAEPSFHATAVLVYRFVTETTVEKVYALQGFVDCLDQETSDDEIK